MPWRQADAQFIFDPGKTIGIDPSKTIVVLPAHLLFSYMIRSMAKYSSEWNFFYKEVQADLTLVMEHRLYS